MERMLRKMAGQLNAFDEPSLMALWERYAEEVSRFEPTKRWEESALVFCMIQGLRWKNQLFDYHLAATVKADKGDLPFEPLLPGSGGHGGRAKRGESVPKRDEGKKSCKILHFRPGDGS